MDYRSEHVNEIIGVLIDTRNELLSIQGSQHGNRGTYIGRDEMIEQANLILLPFGAQVVPRLLPNEYNRLNLHIELHHAKSGQWMSSVYNLDEHMDFSEGDVNQKKGSSITYGIRYALGSMLGIKIGDDDAPAKTPSHQGNSSDPSQLVKRVWAEIYKITDPKERTLLINLISNSLEGVRINAMSDEQCRAALEIIVKYMAR